jgi:hypothetical protein
MGYNGRGFFFVVGYNGRSFPPLWDKTEVVFFLLGYNRRGIFLLWDTMEKNYTTQNDIFTFLLPLRGKN